MREFGSEESRRLIEEGVGSVMEALWGLELTKLELCVVLKTCMTTFDPDGSIEGLLDRVSESSKGKKA